MKNKLTNNKKNSLSFDYYNFNLVVKIRKKVGIIFELR